MKKSVLLIFFTVLTALSLFMHFPHLKKDLISIHVWRQTQTQTTIDNFYEEDFNIFNPRQNSRGDGDGIFRMEFPLMQWLIAGLYKIFGQSIFLTRIFMFITGIFSILGIFLFIRLIFNSDIAGIIAAWALCFSPSFYYYTINPLPDNFAFALSIWGVYFVFKWIKTDKLNNVICGCILLSLATLCKLPFILYWIIIPTHIIIKLFKKEKTLKSFIWVIFVSAAFISLPLVWYLNVISGWKGNGIVTGMLDNKYSWSVIFDYLQNNFISVLPELLINYAAVPFFIIGIFVIFKKELWKSDSFLIYAVWGVAILAYFLFEINMIAKIHDYYLFPFYPLIVILIVTGAKFLLDKKMLIMRYFVLFALILLPITAHLRMNVRWNEDDPGFNKDLLVYKTQLRKAVPDNSLCVVGNDVSHHIFLYYIHKKGWVFEEDNLTADALEDMISRGAIFLYTDSEIILQDKKIQQLLSHKIAQYGTISVWKLKNKL